jgi:hypothetical protein
MGEEIGNEPKSIASLWSGDEGGNADPQARKESLISLVRGNYLNNNEVRLLKELLSTITLQKDIITNLPVELIILVIDKLDAQDIMACLMVSHAWNATLMSDKVVFSMADRLFPQLTWEPLHRSSSNRDAQKTLRLQFVKHLQERLLLHDRVARWDTYRGYERTFLWDTETEFELAGQDYTQFTPPNPRSNERAVYANGRIAWQQETHTLVLDNLRDKSRKLLTFPGARLLGPELKLAALGNQLVIATMDRHVFAWDIHSNVCERKTLPSLPAQCTTSRNQVAIITEKSLYMWSVGGSLIETDLPAHEIEFLAVKQFCKAFVHPRLDHVVYVRRVYRHTSSTLRFVIDKFVHRKHIKTLHYDVDIGWLTNERIASSYEGVIPLAEQNHYHEGRYLHEFDMFHESFLVREIPHNGRRHNETYMFNFDDEFAVELSEKKYWLW